MSIMSHMLVRFMFYCLWPTYACTQNNFASLFIRKVATATPEVLVLIMAGLHYFCYSIFIPTFVCNFRN